MTGPATRRGSGTDRPSAALKQLSALTFDLQTDQPRLDLGPQGKRILKELIAAANAGLWVSVVILAATLVDVCMHESGHFDGISFAGGNGGDGSAETGGVTSLADLGLMITETELEMVIKDCFPRWFGKGAAMGRVK